MFSIPISQERVAGFCQRHHVRRLMVFGSALRDDFRPDSDIDVLADFEPGYEYSLSELLSMERELATLLGRDVDLGDQQSVEEDPNYLRRQNILHSAQVIYER